MATTLKDIAGKSGFSITTVSRALGGYDDVNEQTRAHIKAIAHELGYQPNHIARQLQGKRTETIGFIMPMPEDFHEDDFFSLVLKGITVGAAQYHYHVLTSVVHSDTSEIDVYRRVCGGRQVDGIILTRPRQNDTRIEYLRSINFPFVVFGRDQYQETPDYPFIDVDHESAFEMLTNHFVNYGHHHIGLILSPEDYMMSTYRLAGYKQGLSRANLPYHTSYVTYSNLTYQGGKSSAHYLLTQQPQLTALVCANDRMAIGAMKTIHEMGRHVGNDIAVSGYDGVPEGSRSNPPLTTIRVPIFEIGKQLSTLLIKNITKQQANDQQQIVEPQLVIRDSSGHRS